MAQRNDRALNEEEVTDHVIARTREAVTSADASVINKVKALETLAAACSKLATSLRQGNHDAVIAAAARTAEEAMSEAHDLFLDFVEAVKKPQVLATHPVDVRELDRFLKEVNQMHARLEAWTALYEARVPGVVEQVAALESHVPETVPPIMQDPEPEPEPPDLPF